MKPLIQTVMLLILLANGGAVAAMWKDELSSPGDWSLAYMQGENKVGEGTVSVENGVLIAPIDFRNSDANRLSRRILLPRPRWITFKLRAPGVDLDALRFRIRLESPDAPFAFHPTRVRSEGDWTEFEVNMNKPESLVNVWRFYGQRRLSRLSLVIQKSNGAPTFNLHLAGLEFHYGNERVENYRPQLLDLKPAEPPLIVLCLNRGGEYYQVEEILQKCFPHAHVAVHLYRGQHLPLDDWPPNLSKASLVILVDVDTYVLSDEHLAQLADYVHSGGALLVFAGPSSVNASLDGRPLVSELLPVIPGISDKVRSESPISIAQGFLEEARRRGLATIPTELGYAGPMHEVQVKAESRIVAHDGEGRPVVVMGNFGKGKTALISCWPDAGTDRGRGFFWSAGYPRIAALVIEAISGIKARETQPVLTTESPIKIQFPYQKRVFAPCGPINFEVAGGCRDSKVEAFLYDKAHRQVWKGDGYGKVSGQLPDLADGEYVLIVKCGNLQTSETVVITPPLDRQTFYPIIARIPIQQAGHWFGPKTLCWMVDDVISHGVNTVAIPVGDAIANDPQGFASESAAFLELCAQEKGLAIMYDYTHLPTFARQSRAPFDVRVAEASEKASELARPWTEMADLVPRLFAMKTIDEPTADYANLNLDSDKGAEYREKVGFDPPDAEREFALTGIDRLKHWLFVSEYARKQFALLYDEYHRQGKAWGLLHTFMEPGFGSEPPTKRFEDVCAWGSTADYLDFDIYPYWYPESQKRRFAKVHYGFAFHRCVAQFYGKPMGFYVELDDRNWPFQQNPKEATGELAYVAIGEGCHYLNTFIYGIVGAGSMARPERWEDGGKDLQAIAKTTPLILHTKREPAKVALYFPYRQWIMCGRYYPTFGLELFRRKFGECDVIHEEVALRSGFDPYEAIILLGTDIIPQEIEEKLLQFVRAGGILILDHSPSQSPEGRPLGRLKDLVNAPANLDVLYRTAVEENDHETIRSLESWAREILVSRGIKPAVHCSDDEFEASLLKTEGASVLVVVNHRDETAKCDVEVFTRDVGYVCDLATGKAFDFRRTEDSAVIQLELSSRQGIILGLYPEKPNDPVTQVKVEAGDIVVSLSEATGSPLPVFVDVFEPGGRKSIRHSRQILLRGKSETRSRLAVNEVCGDWRVRITVPALGFETNKYLRI